MYLKICFYAHAEAFMYMSEQYGSQISCVSTILELQVPIAA